MPCVDAELRTEISLFHTHIKALLLHSPIKHYNLIFLIQKKTMENYQHLATESFSYSWLTHNKPTLQLPENNNNPNVEDHQRTEHNFYFDVSLSSSPISLMIHADEIFSDGRIMPIYIDRSRADVALQTSASSVPSSPYPVMIAHHESRRCYFLIRKLRRSSKKILVKCFGFVKSIGCSRKSSRVDDLERKECEVRSWSNSPSRQSSCNSSTSLFLDSLSHDVKKIGGNNNKDGFCYYGFKRATSWGGSPQGPTRIGPSSSRLGSDLESSIHEAILYCKRSIGIILLLIIHFCCGQIYDLIRIIH